MLLADLLRTTSDVEMRRIPRVPVTGVAYDSRKTQAGNVFVGIRGEKTDGTRFFRDAVRHGAAALAAERFVEEIEGVATLRVGDARKFLAQASRAFYMDPASDW